MTRSAILLFSLFFIICPTISQTPTSSISQNNVWLKSGVHVKYTSSSIPRFKLLLPNGTEFAFTDLNTPTVLQWRMLGAVGKIARLNVSFCVNGEGIIISEEESDSKHLIYEKTLLADVDINTREASVNGSSIGKLCFWAETNVTLGQKIVMSSYPSDPLAGNVTGFMSTNLIGRRIESYGVEVFQLNPFIYTQFIFDKQTGIALTYTLMGPLEIAPGSIHNYELLNGTIYNITSYAKTKLSGELGIKGTYSLSLEDTNIDFGQRLQLIPNEAYIAIFLGVFVSLAVIFIMIDRKRHVKSKSGKHERSSHHLRERFFIRRKNNVTKVWRGNVARF